MRKSERILAMDEMHTLRRVDYDPEAPEEIGAVFRRDFAAELRPWAEALEAELMASKEKWPPFRLGIEDHGNGKWRRDPDATPEKLMARWAAGEKFKLTRGADFIEKNVKPLSDDYFRWRLLRVIEWLENSTDPNQKMIAAFELGQTEQIWKARRAFSRGFELGRRAIKGGKAGSAARTANAAPRTAARLARMRELVDAGHSVSRAAELGERAGLGSATSLRALFQRHAKKL